MVNSYLTNCLIIQALGEWDDDTLSFRPNELFLNKLQHASYILGPLVSHKLSDDFDIILFGLVFDGDFLVEDELIGRRCRDLVGDGVSSQLEVDRAGELNF